MQLLIRRLIRKIAKLGDKAFYSGENPFNDLAKLGLVESTSTGTLLAMYITPRGEMECVFQGIKPWQVFETLQPIWFNPQMVDKEKFVGGPYDKIIRRVLQKLV